MRLDRMTQQDQNKGRRGQERGGTVAPYIRDMYNGCWWRLFRDLMVAWQPQPKNEREKKRCGLLSTKEERASSGTSTAKNHTNHHYAARVSHIFLFALCTRRLTQRPGLLPHNTYALIRGSVGAWALYSYLSPEDKKKRKKGRRKNAPPQMNFRADFLPNQGGDVSAHNQKRRRWEGLVVETFP